MEAEEKEIHAMTLRLPSELVHHIKLLAAKNKRSLRGEIETALEEYVKKHQNES